MRYPSLQKPNMRYRGPMESRKSDKLLAEVFSDFVYLFAKTDEQIETFDTVVNALLDGKTATGARKITGDDDVYDVPDIRGLSDASRSIANMRHQVAYMKGRCLNV